MLDFVMVIMASGIARGRVRTTTMTKELPKMAAIFRLTAISSLAGLQRTSLMVDIHPCYGQNKVSAGHNMTTY